MEVILDSGLDRIWFPVPSECIHLLEETKQLLLHEVSLGTQEEKTKDFQGRCEEIVFEMQHIESLAQNTIFRLMKDHYMAFKTFNFAVAILINLALVLSFRAEDPFTSYAKVDDDMKLLVLCLGLLNGVLSFIVVSFTVISRAPLIRRHLVRIQRDSLEPGRGLGDFAPTITLALMLFAMTAIVYLRFPELVPALLIAAGCTVFLSSLRALRTMWVRPVSAFSINYCWIYDCLCNKRILWQVFYFAASIWAALVHPVGYTVLLFDICMMSPTLQNVLRSIAQPAPQLGMTVSRNNAQAHLLTLESITT